MPFVDVDQKRLHYADSHPQGAPEGGLTLIFIHGLGSSQNYYFPILPDLTPHHRCITVDTYGSGRSAYTGLEQSVGTMVADFAGVLDALKIRKAVVVGHSLGGTVALHLAIQFPDRVIGVVSIGPVHPSATTGGIFEKRMQVVSEDGMEPMANTIPDAATGSRSRPLHKAFIRELLLGQNPLGYISLCRVVSSATAPDYAAVKAPLLLIAGDEDKSAPLDGCKHIFSHVSSQNKRFEVLAGVGHWHCIEASDEVGKLIANFAKSISA
ncbi:hypothetical protein VTN77DRAFT_46 [Rasamsonia byssochlamydoides]|uniref:uncharacterized protein n=1 Tax=Rasamsonia byssochlamydoides TaxID=89139 RepID=UPI0037436DE4